MKPIWLAAALLCAANLAHADQYTDVMANYAKDHIMGWATDPALISAVRLQNMRHSGLNQAAIDEMDRKWRQEVGLSDRPTVDPVLSNAASDNLRGRVAASDGVVTEVFLMDNKGLNVAASEPTSDYWQGDEAKFTETFGKGPSAVHIGDIEYDESTQTYQGQVSISVTDPETGTVIGAMTVGLNAEKLF